MISDPPVGGSGLFLPAPSLPLSLLSSDTNTVVGLPRPIHESIRTLKLVSALMNSSSPCHCVGAPSPSPALIPGQGRWCGPPLPPAQPCDRKGLQFSSCPWSLRLAEPLSSLASSLSYWGCPRGEATHQHPAPVSIGHHWDRSNREGLEEMMGAGWGWWHRWWGPWCEPRRSPCAAQVHVHRGGASAHGGRVPALAALRGECGDEDVPKLPSWGPLVPPGLLAGLGGSLRWGGRRNFSGAEWGVCGEASGRSWQYPTLGVGEPGAEPDPQHWWQLLV